MKRASTPETNEPEKGTLKDCFPLKPIVFRVHASFQEGTWFGLDYGSSEDPFNFLETSGGPAPEERHLRRRLQRPQCTTAGQPSSGSAGLHHPGIGWRNRQD